MNNKYIGIHSNDLNRTRYGEIVLYVEGQPVGFFSSSGDFVISGSLGIGGIANVSASIAGIRLDTGSLMITGSVSGDTITFTKGDGTTFQLTVDNVASASYATTASYTVLAVSASSVKIVNAGTDNQVKYIAFTDKAQGYGEIGTDSGINYNPFTNTLQTSNFLGNLQGSASYALTASYVPAVAFDGNRPITQVLLPDLVNYNPGTSNVVDFLEQVFYPEEGFGIEIFSPEVLSIMEHARSGSYVWANNVGYDNYNPDPIAKFTANVPVSWSLQTNNLLSIHPTNGELTIKTNISGSTVYIGGSTAQGTVVATAVAGGYKTRDFSVNIKAQNPPQIRTSDYIFTVNNIFVTASGAQLGYFTAQDLTFVPYGSCSLIGSGGLDVDKFTFIQDDDTAGSYSTRYRVETTQALNSGSYVYSLTASNGYGTIYAEEFTTTVQQNNAPTITIVNSPYIKTITQATSGSAFGSLTIQDLQSGIIPPGTPKYGLIFTTSTFVDRIVSASLTGTDADKFEFRPLVSSSTPTYLNYPYTITYGIYFKEAGVAGTYNITASGFDQFGNTAIQPISNSVQIPRPAIIQQNSTAYIIESALSGSKVTTDSTHGVDPNFPAYVYTDQPVSWSLDDPNNLFAISGSNTVRGYLTLKADLSGSAIQYPNTLTVLVLSLIHI